MIKIYQSGNEFLNENKNIILEDELKNQFLYIDAIHCGEKDCDKENYFIKIYDKNQFLFAARIEDKPLVVVGENLFVNELIKTLDDLDCHFDAIYGCSKIIEHFKNQYMISHGVTFEFIVAMDKMVFQGQAKFDSHIRLCTEYEIEILITCFKNFHMDCFHENINDEKAIETIQNRDGMIYGYFVNDRLTSIVSLSKEIKNYQSIGYAYTFPNDRGKGYIQALMLHCAKLIEQNCKTAMLHVDRANPISNHAYKKIGFVINEESINYKVIR